jgi:hypothetical protein
MPWRGWIWIVPLSLALFALAVAAEQLGDHGRASVKLIGPEQTVFDWDRDACEATDVPDAPARAFRDDRGRVQLYASHYVTRRSIGQSLDGVRHECRVVMQSHFNPRPEAFDDRQWLASPFTEDGRSIYALVHNEYQGNQHPGRCPSGVYQSCWYNSITTASSTDAGDSFFQQPAPARIAATVPYRYVPDTGRPYGLFQPSNIVKRNGFYYALLQAEGYGEQKHGTCVIRTADLSQARSWRAWDGDGFDVGFVDPYREPVGDPAQHVCEPVAKNEIEKMAQSVTYNTYFGKYLLVGVAGESLPPLNRSHWGIYFSLSEDLIHWSPRRPIAETELPWTFQCGDPYPVLYPSILDPQSESRNFSTTGRSPYLYFTRLKYPDCRQALERDLVRIRIEFSKDGNGA